MLKALDAEKDECLAWLTEKTQKPFTCPSCESEVILKKGLVNEHHFAHKPPVNCSYGSGESQLHLKIKREIYEALSAHPDCSKCKMERYLKKVRPDVSANIHGVKVAIEVQRSDISIETIRRRMSCYADLNIHVVWVLTKPFSQIHRDDVGHVHNIKEWEKYLHAMYYGQIYYWLEGAQVMATHFDKVELYKESTEWYIPDGGGEMDSAGGYSYTAKKLRKVNDGGSLHLVDDFIPKKKDRFIAKNWVTPNCLIWQSKLKRWW